MATRRRWTDEELREAVTTSASYVKVLRALGLSGRGGCHYDVKRRVAELGLDTSHFTSSRNTCPWTDEQLRAAVSVASSLSEVLVQLGMQRSGGGESRIRRRIRLLALDTSHFVCANGRPARRRAWADDDLRAAVVASTSVAQVIRALGLVPAGGSYDQVQRRILALELDTRHFTGAGWRRGSTVAPRAELPLTELLVDGRWIGSHHLKERLFRAGLKRPVCELCGWAETRACDGRIPVELDHRNGNKTDNRLENLRILCPNCHALQPTHRALNRRTRRSAS